MKRLNEIFGNRKAGDLRGEEEEEEKTVNNSSLSLIQHATLAISSVLLCWLPLFSGAKYDNQETTAVVALLMAALASCISLEKIPGRPHLSRLCGLFAVLSLLFALASLLSSSILCFFTHDC